MGCRHGRIPGGSRSWPDGGERCSPRQSGSSRRKYRSIRPNLAGRDPFRRRAPGFATGDWAGAERGRVDDSDYSAAATFIAARWMVPVTYPFDPDGYTSIVDGFWVGIDGAEQRQILQAGIAADVQPGYLSSDIDYYAWASGTRICRVGSTTSRSHPETSLRAW